MLRLAGDGPLAIGGICGAVEVAEGIAHRLAAQTGRPPPLLALEKAPAPPYPGTVALFLPAEDQRHNPFHAEARPQEAWQRDFGAVTSDIVPGGHSATFLPPALEGFAARLAARLDPLIGPLIGPPPGPGPER